MRKRKSANEEREQRKDRRRHRDDRNTKHGHRQQGEKREDSKECRQVVLCVCDCHVVLSGATRDMEWQGMRSPGGYGEYAHRKKETGIIDTTKSRHVLPQHQRS